MEYWFAQASQKKSSIGCNASYAVEETVKYVEERRELYILLACGRWDKKMWAQLALNPLSEAKG